MPLVSVDQDESESKKVTPERFGKSVKGVELKRLHAFTGGGTFQCYPLNFLVHFFL